METSASFEARSAPLPYSTMEETAREKQEWSIRLAELQATLLKLGQNPRRTPDLEEPAREQSRTCRIE